MPVSVKKVGEKYRVVGPNGQPEKNNSGTPVDGGGFDTRDAALKQMSAINLSKRRRGDLEMSSESSKGGAKLMAEENIIIIQAQEMEDDEMEDEMEAPPIVIVSDGTVGGTKLIIHGKNVEYDSMSMYCTTGDYACCDMSLTVRETGPDGLEVRRTLTLRKDESVEKTVSSAAKKSDPNAKVRNRGKVVFSNTHSKVTDNKDHFPINDAAQARNALARVAQFSAAPKWWSGSLKQLQSAVRSAVSKAYPGIKVSE